MQWKNNGLFRAIIYVAGLVGLSSLSDQSDESIRSIFTLLWVALVAFIIIYEFIYLRFKRFQTASRRNDDIDEMEVFFNQQALIVSDPSIPPTHSFDPEFGYEEVSSAQPEPSVDNNLQDQDVYPLISDDLMAKIDNDDHLSADEFLQLVHYTDSPSLLYNRLSKSDQSRRDVITEGVKSMGTFLRFTPEEFRDDEDIVNAAISNGRNALDFASQRIRDSKQKWVSTWPELNEMLHSKEYPDFRSDKNCALFLKKLTDVMQHEEFNFSDMDAGDIVGFFGNGFVQAVCHYKHVYVLTDGERALYDPVTDKGRTVYVEKFFRLYFKFITNGDFDDQPFIRITFRYENYDPGQTQSVSVVTDFRWYDGYTKSPYPSNHKAFFARLCLDIKDYLPATI